MAVSYILCLFFTLRVPYVLCFIDGNPDFYQLIKKWKDFHFANLRQNSPLLPLFDYFCEMIPEDFLILSNIRCFISCRQKMEIWSACAYISLHFVKMLSNLRWLFRKISELLGLPAAIYCRIKYWKCTHFQHQKYWSGISWSR